MTKDPAKPLKGWCYAEARQAAFFCREAVQGEMAQSAAARHQEGRMDRGGGAQPDQGDYR